MNLSLSALASILLNIIAPIVIVAGLGWVLARVFAVESRSLSRASLYVFAPALVFTQVYRSKLGDELVSIGMFTVTIAALMGVVAFALIKALRYDRLMASAFALSTLFVNAGNYGLPLNLFAFGEAGLARAIIFFAASAILLQTAAVFIAARGRASTRDALLNVFKMPLVYAVTLGLVFNRTGFVIPEPLMRSLDLAGAAAVPLMLVILGIELSRVTLNQDLAAVGLAAVVKLVITPIVAFGLAEVMGLTGLTRAVCIVEASMPTAVVASILSVEFKSRPEFVTSAVLVSTLGSIVSLTVLLGILK
jgi:predicted permease